jgi:chromate transporter
MKVPAQVSESRIGNPLEVLWVALKLGSTSFGGPIAHLGYFERTYVHARRWLNEEEYGGLVSLCQLLPGPTSSQVGFLIGLHRAGWLGAVMAWMGFTLPSALLMYGFALCAPSLTGPRTQSLLHGLMLTAVVIVAQAVWSMARSLAPDLPRRLIAILGCLLLLSRHGGWSQFATLVAGGVAGGLACRTAPRVPTLLPGGPKPCTGSLAILLFVLLLVSLAATAAFDQEGPIALANIFYRSGAFVFGGGHVVLPLLQQAMVPTGWISNDRFLAGYGLAQSVPGPLFTLAAYLGAVSAGSNGSPLWAVLALVSIFLPGILLAIGGRAMLERVAAHPGASGILAGINAAVVGVLAAALYDPVWTSAVHSLSDVAVILAVLILLQKFKIPPLLIAALCVGTSVGVAMGVKPTT